MSCGWEEVCCNSEIAVVGKELKVQVPEFTGKSHKWRYSPAIKSKLITE